MKKIKYLLFTITLFLCMNQVNAIDHFTAKANDNITIDKNYNSSVVLAGENIELNGAIKGIAFIAANNIEVNNTNDYALIAGNNIKINTNTKKDALIAGNIVNIDKDSIFQRDTLIAAESVTLSGTYERDLNIYANKVTIKNANIKRNLNIEATVISIDNNTKINKTLNYPKNSSITISKQTQINKINKTKPIKEKKETYLNNLSSNAMSYLSLTLIFAALTLLIPKVFDIVENKYKEITLSKGLEVFTKGIVFIILIPIVSIILCCTVIGIPLALILLALYIIAIYISKIYTAYLLGYKIWQKAFNKEAHILFFGLIGLLTLFILSLIPGINVLVSFISLFIGLGLILETIKPK